MKCLGTEADFSELFPLDFRHLGTGSILRGFVPHGLNSTFENLGTDDRLRQIVLHVFLSKRRTFPRKESSVPKRGQVLGNNS